MADISRANCPSFRSEGDAGVNGTSATKETYSVTKVKMCLIKYEDYEETFFLASDVGVAVLVCLSSLIYLNRVILSVKL